MIKFKLSIGALILGASVLLLSCEEKTKIEKFDASKVVERPNMAADTLTVLRSDSARVILKFTAPYAVNNKDENQVSYMECPNGFLIERYNTEGVTTSRISAEYGKVFEKEGKYEALGNVVVTTEKGDTLKTEQLIYLEKKDRIYSEKYVRIYQKDRILEGVGFESDSNMENRTFYKTRGDIYIEKQPSQRRLARQDSLTNDSTKSTVTE